MQYGMRMPQNSMVLPMTDASGYVPYLAELVAYAQANIPLYAELYEGYNVVITSEGDFAALPLLHEGVLVREQLGSMVTDITAVFEVCYPMGLLASDSCPPRLQSQEDQEDQYLILAWILETCLGMRCEQDKPAVALVTDEAHSYGAGAWCKMLQLLLKGPFSALVTRGHAPREVAAELSLGSPEIVIAAGPVSWESIPHGVHTVIEIGENPTLGVPIAAKRHGHLLMHPLLGSIGCSVDKPGYYAYNPDYYYVESSTEGMLVYTSFMQHYMPMLRLRSRHWGRVIEPGLLHITYCGTH